VTATEQARLKEAAKAEKTAPAGEHVEFQWRDGAEELDCIRCGRIKPRKGWPGPCPGKVKIGLRGGGPPGEGM